MQARNKNNAKGIDVSHWQGQIDWTKVKASGITFAFMKATEGQSYTDSLFSSNLTKAKAAGILTGAYHFCRAQNINEALLEANHFLSAIQANGGYEILDLPPVLDIETLEARNKVGITSVCTNWLEKVESEIGEKPLIYTNQNVALNYLDKSLAVYPLWLARYNINQPSNVSGWTRWQFLQYSNSGTVAGITGNVDFNEYDGTVNELETLSLARQLRHQLGKDLETLSQIINSPEYWKQNAVPGKSVKGEYVSQLIKAYASLIEPNLMLHSAIEIMKNRSIIQSPEYWQNNAMSGKTLDGSYVAQLIKNMAESLTT